jgi:hypothetical protein
VLSEYSPELLRQACSNVQVLNAIDSPLETARELSHPTYEDSINERPPYNDRRE